MTYDIVIDARTEAGVRLDSVHLRNAPEDANKVVRIRESMMRDGWTGRPVILADCGDHHIAFTGSHRLAAAQGLDDLIEAVMLPDDLSSDDWDMIDAANDDDDLLSAFVEIAAARGDMAAVVEAMQQEVAAN